MPRNKSKEPQSELDRVLSSHFGHWSEIVAKNEDHFQALPLLLRSAFAESVHVLGQKDKNALITATLRRRDRKALEKVGYKVNGWTNDPGP